MKYLKVKFLKHHPEFSYSAGDIGTVSDDKAASLLKTGHVIVLPEADEDDKENPLPEDFPARDILFAAGFATPEDVQAAGESITDTKGVGKNTYKQIVAYFEK